MKTLTFHIISNNAAPFINDGLFHIVGAHEYDITAEFTEDMAVAYARRWFTQQMLQYGVNVTDLDIELGRVHAEYSYYLACPEIKELDFAYSIKDTQVKILTKRERDYAENAIVIEEMNFSLYNGLSA